MNKMPVIFSGHGDPMIALRNDEITEKFTSVGEMILRKYGRPKAILAISAHWYTRGSFVQTVEQPRQVYDMYGFPQELYEVKYPVNGSRQLSERVISLLGDDVKVNDEWGIDHGTWTVLTHMFPKADIPVVQLSVDGTVSTEKAYELGRNLAALRDEGYLIFGSGNIVHNLGLVEWNNLGGTEMAQKFNQYVIDAITFGEIDKLIHFEDAPYAGYAIPTPDHYLPLIYCLGAAEGDKAEVFNNVCNLGSMSMTGFVFSNIN